MSRRTVLLACLCILGFTCWASATPVNGIYLSQELGGGVIDGRWSEAWLGGQEGALGNTINAASWNGSTLGTMWELTGPAINTVTQLPDKVEYGLTVKEYYTTYSGGTLKLKNTGPWWNGTDAEYNVTINGYSHDTFKYFTSGGTFVRATTLVHLIGTFDAFPAYSVDFILAVAVPVGRGATPPAGYPAFAIDAPGGAWGVAQKITMEIVPEPATMALLGLGGLLLRRRK